MSEIHNLSVKISNYKCFGEAPFGFDQILPLNLIIGRNNTGKSTLLDLISYLTYPTDLSALGNKGQTPKITVTGALAEAELRRVFASNTSGGSIHGNHWEDYGRHWIGRPVTLEIRSKGIVLDSTDPPFSEAVVNNFGQQLANTKGNPFASHRFRRLLADRDISRETETDHLEIKSNGEGVTNAVRSYLNKATLPSSLVEGTILNELNAIFEPDGHVSRILVQQIGDHNSPWEIYLEEAEKGRVSLSHTGSGLKTLLLVLVFLYLIPHVEGRSLSQYFFGFEELENNLHPALLRRLLLYLREVAVREGCRFFLTTHSNVAIDLFASDASAQIIHVTHDRSCASVRRVTTYVENKGVLDDLDVRASDLLQANGIVWLEGPSDRLYFNRWVELWSGGELREGAHYQCVFYGGRLLAHLSAADPDVETADVVKILRVNRNAILLIDSDRRRRGQPINATKQRIIAEIRDLGGLAWLTAGREVENYIPDEAVAAFYKLGAAKPLDKYADFSEHIDDIDSGAGKRFLRNKVLFAEQVCPYITEGGIARTLDLKTQLTAACDLIRRWSSMAKH